MEQQLLNLPSLFRVHAQRACAAAALSLTAPGQAALELETEGKTPAKTSRVQLGAGVPLV